MSFFTITCNKCGSLSSPILGKDRETGEIKSIALFCKTCEMYETYEQSEKPVDEINKKQAVN